MTEVLHILGGKSIKYLLGHFHSLLFGVRFGVKLSDGRKIQ
jgi:hypothetical protein